MAKIFCGQGLGAMSVVVQMPAVGETKDRRIHLRDVAATTDGMTVGQLLRSRREALGLDEQTVASRLCIRRDLVVAIEAGDHSRLPGRAYALGFIRSYALLVGLDAQDIVARFKAETLCADASRSEVMVFPDTAPTARFSHYHLVGAAVLVAGVVYLLIQAFASTPTVQPVTVVDAASSVTVVEPVPAPAPVTAAPPQAPAAESLPATADVASAGPSAVAAAAAAVTPAADTSAVSEVPGARVSRITLKASEASYVEVKDPALTGPDSVLIARELASGESFDVPDRAGLVLLAGNAGGLVVAVDGRDAGPLGDRGQVIRRLVLDPAYFQSRSATSR
jgi:cytoskeleton protein RodZ